MKKGYTIISIPTKPHIKAFIQSQYGADPVPLTFDNVLGRKLYDLLEHRTNENASDYNADLYPVSFPLVLSRHLFKQRGDALNETNIRNFNLFMEEYIKDKYFFIMDMFMTMGGKFINNYKTETQMVDGVPTMVRVQSKRGKFINARNLAREALGIPETMWNDETMKKIYDRRLKAIECGEKPIPKIVTMIEREILKTVNF